MTVEATAEGTAATVMAGSGAVFNVGNRAVLNLAAAGSTGAVGTGAMLSSGLQRVGRVFSFSASATAANARFRDIAAVMGEPFPRLQLSASTGLSPGRYGSVGLACAQQRRDAAASSTPLPGGARESQPARSARLVSASYSVQLRGMAIYATGFRSLDDAGVSGIMVGLTLPLGTRDSVGASLNSSAGRSTAQVQAQQSAVTTGDWGYQAYATSGSAAHQFMQLENKTPWALLSAGVVVTFLVKISRGALLRLVDHEGAVVPVGSTATLRSTGATVPVGYDGAVYVEELEPRNEAAVELANGQRCSVVFGLEAYFIGIS